MTSHAIKQFLSVAFSIKRAVGLKRSVTFRHLVLLQAPAMPTTWYYISGCPFPAECTRYKTTASKKKSLVFSGLTKEDAEEGVRKAQKIALSAAQAFGEVSSKLKESYHKLAFIATQGGFFGSGPS